MTPIQKAKEICERFLNRDPELYFNRELFRKSFDEWAATPQAAALLSGWKEDEWARKLYDNLHHIFHQYSDEWSGYQEQATEKLLTEYESFAKITKQ